MQRKAKERGEKEEEGRPHILGKKWPKLLELTGGRNQFSWLDMSRDRRPTPPVDANSQWIGESDLVGFATARTTAHRLFSSHAAWLERFGDDVLLSYQKDAARKSALVEFRAWSAEHQFAYRRIFGKLLPRQNADRAAPVVLEGDAAASLQTVVEEHGIKFGVDFGAGYSAGLFLDQRANRAFVRRSGAKRMLNTFAYTCSFSVAAALGGAATVSIDLSKKSLDRGRENFLLNEVDPGEHCFLADDVLEVLPRLQRKAEKFDTIVLDPPTFSRGNKGRKFQVEESFLTLLLAALELAAPGARVLLSTNCSRLSRRALEAIARTALKTLRLSARLHVEPELPDIPAEFAAQTLWLLLR
jgi:23S rRNA (cytosine1962-C5)-methyltransferase